MKVIFIEDVPRVARAGDIKEVADGYAQHFLIPKKLAAAATERSLADAKAQVERRARERAQTETEMKALAAQLEGKEIVLTAKTGGKEKLYGSITAEDIAAGLEKDLAAVVDKRKIELAESIRQTGTYDIVIRFTADVSATIKVTVKGQESE